MNLFFEVLVSFSNSMITNKGLLFNSKFWFFFYYFLGLKRKLFIANYFQTDDQPKKQNNIIKGYFWTFINFEENN